MSINYRVLKGYKAYCEATEIKILPNIKGDDIITFEVQILDTSKPTRNGVRYPKEELQKALKENSVQQRLKTGSFYGEYDHPIDPENIVRWLRQEMPMVSHKWNKLWFKGDILYGECQTYTGNGNWLGHAIKGGELPSFSIRALAEPVPEDKHVKLTNILLSTIDWVRYPGNPDSFVTDSNEFKVIDTPLHAGFNYSDRAVAMAESAGIVDEFHDLVSVGEGFFLVVDKITNDREKEINNARSKAFGW